MTKKISLLAAALAILATGLLWVQQSQSAQFIITWSPPKLSQTLFPGTRNFIVPVYFRTDEAVKNVEVLVQSQKIGVVSVEPTFFPEILPGYDHELTLVFNAPQLHNDQAENFSLAIQLQQSPTARRLQERLEPALPVLLRTDPLAARPLTPDDTLELLAKALESGDVESALQKVSISEQERARDDWVHLDSKGLARLASMFREAEVVHQTDHLKVYEKSWLWEDGTPTKVELRVALTYFGKWLLASW